MPTDVIYRSLNRIHSRLPLQTITNLKSELVSIWYRMPMWNVITLQPLTSTVPEWQARYRSHSRIQKLPTSWRDANHQTSSLLCPWPACSTWPLQLSITLQCYTADMKMYSQHHYPQIVLHLTHNSSVVHLNVNCQGQGEVWDIVLGRSVWRTSSGAEIRKSCEPKERLWRGSVIY